MHDVTDCAGIEEVYGACSKPVKMSSCTHILLIVIAALTMSACDAITADVLRTLKSSIAAILALSIFAGHAIFLIVHGC